MSAKTTTAKKTGKKDEKVVADLDVNFNIETVTFDDLKSKIKNDDDYDKIFNKLSEHYANFWTEKNDLEAKLVTIATKHKKTVTLMQALHKEFKDDKESDEEKDDNLEQDNEVKVDSKQDEKDACAEDAGAEDADAEDADAEDAGAEDAEDAEDADGTVEDKQANEKQTSKKPAPVKNVP